MIRTLVSTLVISSTVGCLAGSSEDLTSSESSAQSAASVAGRTKLTFKHEPDFNPEADTGERNESGITVSATASDASLFAGRTDVSLWCAVPREGRLFARNRTLDCFRQRESFDMAHPSTRDDFERPRALSLVCNSVRDSSRDLVCTTVIGATGESCLDPDGKKYRDGAVSGPFLCVDGQFLFYPSM